MKETTATDFRKNIFKALEDSAHSIPTRIVYSKGDSVLMSYEDYLIFLNKKKSLKSTKLLPLVAGKILKKLDEKSEDELLAYMGIS